MVGDICLPGVELYRHPNYSTRNQNAKIMKRQRKFFQECSQSFSVVYMILGNHEHYHGRFYESKDKLQSYLDEWGCYNIKLLENDVVEFGKYRLFGATFWTDVYKGDPLICMDVEGGMNDHRYIRDEDGNPITTRLTRSENAYTRRLIQQFLNEPSDKQNIVMTHHAPFYMSVPDNFKSDTVSFAYANTGIEYMVDPYVVRPTFWLHGHTHSRFSYSFGNIQVMCHPRGYWNEQGLDASNYNFRLLPDSVEIEQ